MSDCALCTLFESLPLDPARAREVFLCGVATGEYLAYRGHADLCESCADTVARARAAIRAARSRA